MKPLLSIANADAAIQRFLSGSKVEIHLCFRFESIMSTMTNLLPERIIIMIRLFMFVHTVILNISAQMCRAA